MSMPVSGNYYLVNGASDSSGDQFAIQFQGQGAPLRIEQFAPNQTSQVWTISDYNSTTQSISPKDDPNLQIAYGDNYLTTLPTSYPWAIRGDGFIYTVQDAGLTVYWDVTQVGRDEPVTYSSASGRDTEEWWLYEEQQFTP